MRFRTYSRESFSICDSTNCPRASLCICESGTEEGQASSQRMQFEQEVIDSSMSWSSLRLSRHCSGPWNFGPGNSSSTSATGQEVSQLVHL